MRNRIPHFGRLTSETENGNEFMVLFNIEHSVERHGGHTKEHLEFEDVYLVFLELPTSRVYIDDLNEYNKSVIICLLDAWWENNRFGDD